MIETTWVTDTGWVVIHDALTIGEWAPSGEGSGAPDTEHESDHSLLRTMTCIDGEVEMEMECVPRFAYGAEAAEWSGGELGEAVAERRRRDRLLLTSDMELSIDGDRRARHDAGCARTKPASARSPGATATWAARAARPRRSSGSTRPKSSGAAGCATATSPTTPGGCTCSARRWSSRG